ncbi:MAG: hypothetical protein KatS3mg028_0436 [Bacteroidia bacterium]|nr:MAG: hypothetical protein KatS3mg028_0436 [Bacteroidia bacterium]
MRAKNIIKALPFVVSFSFAQNSFVGKIEFFFYQRDTTKNVYLVKEPFVRLDQYSKKNDGSLEGSFLFHLVNKDIKMLSHKRKLWNIHKSTVPPVTKGHFEIIPTKNTKKIANFNCTEYIVRNIEEDTEISYWICETCNFTFFQPLLALWNRKDKQSVYFNQIKNLPKGAMPLLSIEKQISTGKIISKLEATKITTEKLSGDMFQIPAGYKKFEE